MKISLIIPVYNAEKTLPTTLESIRAQRFRDFEVIFAEDAGSDGSAALLEAFCKNSGLPCKLLRAEKNGGAAAARNRALEAVEGEYLAFADADDLMDPGMVELAAATVDASDQPVDIVGWDWTLGLNQDGRYMRQADYETAEEALRNLMGGTMRWNLWLFLVRRELIGTRLCLSKELDECRYKEKKTEYKKNYNRRSAVTFCNSGRLNYFFFRFQRTGKESTFG